MTIRSFNSADRSALYELHCDAFSTFQVFGPPWWSDVPTLQDLLTLRQDFRPELSRLAVDDNGHILGHGLWNSYNIRFNGQGYKALVLAPLGVRAGYQGQGIGSRLMDDGLNLGRELGYDLAIILGHPDYYTRFGLKTWCFGTCGLMVELPGPGPIQGNFRPLRPGDSEEILKLWFNGRSLDKGCLEPDTGALGWFSRVTGIVSGVLEWNGRIQAYVRADIRPGSSGISAIKEFLAESAEASQSLLQHLKTLSPPWGKEFSTVNIPIDPLSASAATLFPTGIPRWEPLEAAMACVLTQVPEKLNFLNTMLEEIRSTGKGLLSIQWGPLFDE